MNATLASPIPRATRGPGYQALLVWLLSLNFGIVFFDRNSLNFLMPFVQPDLQLSDGQVGAVAGITAAFFTQADYHDSLDALSAGAAEPRLLVTDTIGLDATPANFEALKQRTHQCKVLIAP